MNECVTWFVRLRLRIIPPGACWWQLGLKSNAKANDRRQRGLPREMHTSECGREAAASGRAECRQMGILSKINGTIEKKNFQAGDVKHLKQEPESAGVGGRTGWNRNSSWWLRDAREGATGKR